MVLLKKFNIHFRLKLTPNSGVWSQNWTTVAPTLPRTTPTMTTSTMTSSSRKSFISSTEKRSNEKSRLLLNNKSRTDKRRTDECRTDKIESNRWTKLVGRSTSTWSWSCRNGNSSFKEPGKTFHLILSNVTEKLTWTLSVHFQVIIVQRKIHYKWSRVKIVHKSIVMLNWDLKYKGWCFTLASMSRLVIVRVLNWDADSSLNITSKHLNINSNNWGFNSAPICSRCAFSPFIWQLF